MQIYFHVNLTSENVLYYAYSPLLDTLDLGPRFQLEMEVRPQVTSGVLLHVPRAEGYFSLYIHQGAVSQRHRSDNYYNT